MHKDDLENTLAADPRIEIIQPSRFGMPTPDAVQHDIQPADLFAIASFNLLGLQASTRNIDFAWLQRVVGDLRRRSPTSETALFETRLRVLRKEITPEQAIAAYQQISAGTEPKQNFTFTGVKYHARIDSYFDPFGNLSIRERAILETAREEIKLKRFAEGKRLEEELQAESRLTAEQRAQLATYWDRYVMAASK